MIKCNARLHNGRKVEGNEGEMEEGSLVGMYVDGGSGMNNMLTYYLYYLLVFDNLNYPIEVNNYINITFKHLL